ncbi:hypothetical protein ACQKIE_09930 [Luteibacter sp. NPDC031894]|uniref:hypothetical protein n=1 Tax=Luteibacter sp. NPDC031894 TaxID=3390572 RepID=UPI003D05B10F
MEGKKAPDWERIEVAVARGGEAFLVFLWRYQLMAGRIPDERIAMDIATDAVVYEMSLPCGRLDIAVFHVDGTVSVIEVKDGTKGYTHVVAGIGQASLYATQIAFKGQVKGVRRFLMWSSVDVDTDRKIEDACTLAGVNPLPLGSIRAYLQALTHE